MRNSGFIATCMPTFEEVEVGASGVTMGAEDPEPAPGPWWYGAARGDAVADPPPPPPWVGWPTRG